MATKISREERKKMIFVFGSNLAGRHGKGAALTARNHHGAIYGRGIGLQGRSYAIPTKDFDLRVLPIERVKTNIEEFVEFAKKHPELTFNITKVGCGLAGFDERKIAPMFMGLPSNCKLPEGWEFVRRLKEPENV